MPKVKLHHYKVDLSVWVGKFQHSLYSERLGFYFLHLASTGLSIANMQVTPWVTHPVASHHRGKTNTTKTMEVEQTTVTQADQN